MNGGGGGRDSWLHQTKSKLCSSIYKCHRKISLSISSLDCASNPQCLSIYYIIIIIICLSMYYYYILYILFLQAVSKMEMCFVKTMELSVS